MENLTLTKNNSSKTALLVKLALLTALSVVGSYLKFPSPVGSIALDSLPGYLGALVFGGEAGALILALGHLLSALNSGFVLGPLHLLIALMMGGCGYIFIYLKKKNIYLAVLLTTLINGIASAAVLIPFLGRAFFYGTAPLLSLAAFVNILLAVIIFRLIKDKLGV